MRSLFLLGLLLAAPALADVVLYCGGSAVGPVTSIDLSGDGGSCGRAGSRAVFSAAGTGSCASHQFVTAVNGSAAGPTCAQPAFTDISGCATAAQGGTCQCAGPGDDQLLVGNGSSCYELKTLPGCDTATQVLAYSTATNTWSCAAAPAGSAHNLLSSSHSDTTGAGTEAAGDVLYRDVLTGKWAPLHAGTSTQVLHGGTTPSWSSVTLTTDVAGVLPLANGGTGVAAQSKLPSYATRLPLPKCNPVRRIYCQP